MCRGDWGRMISVVGYSFPSQALTNSWIVEWRNLGEAYIGPTYQSSLLKATPSVAHCQIHHRKFFFHQSSRFVG